MLLNKRAVLAGLVAAAMLSATLAAANNAHAQNYPNRPITVIVPYAGGSASDIVSRVLLQKMGSILGQSIVVENKPGAGGNVGTAQAAKATPDGYTLLGVAAGPVTTGLMLYKDIGFEAKDLVLISPFASFTVVITASNKLGVRTVKELIERAKKEPGALNYGSVGIGSSQHLAGEYFSQLTGTKLTHIPYRNIAQFGPDLMEGRVQLGFAWYPNVSGPISANGATALAVAGDKRLTAVLPDTPTTAEAGLPEYKVDGWFGLGAPSGVSKEIQQRLNAALLEALKDPAVLESFEKIGAVQIGRDLAQSSKFWDDEIAKYRGIVTKAGIGKID
jgi:tripartite-type tricarboxylate transporter receptor subunit TctC